MPRPDDSRPVGAACDALLAHPFEPFPRAAVDQSIPASFAAQVARDPGRLALRAGGVELSYGELHARAGALATRLLDARGEGEEPIALLLPQGWAPVVALLGILQAGKAYVPLDPGHPRARTAFIVGDAAARANVTDRAHRALARELAGEQVDVVELEELRDGGSWPALAVPPDRLAAVVYTSGSTGQPKGVQVTHRTMLHEILRLTDSLRIARTDRHTLVRSVAFNGAARDVFGTLLNGASLHQLDIEGAGLDGLADWLAREGITAYRSTTSVFRRFAAALPPAHRLGLRLVHMGGEVMTRGDVELFRRHCPRGSALVHGLGITEAGTVRHFFIDHETAIPDGPVPLGYALPDVEVVLLREDGTEAGVGEPGEIAVRSRYLSPGYWRRPDVTRARFLADPAGGPERTYLTGDVGVMLPGDCLVHQGRKDFQVKVRGHRIEIEEVEGALAALDGIRDAVVALWDGGTGEAQLVAYVVPDRGPLPAVGALRRTLGATLPAHMIPSAFVALDAIPLTAQGKVDRRGLPPPPRQRPDLGAPAVPPRTPVERALADIWADVLGLDVVGVDDEFLDLGGDSLRAAQIAARARERFAVALSPTELFAAPTVAAMAVAVVQARLDATPRRAT
jgi:amino acid adenylation domain-containing protein